MMTREDAKKIAEHSFPRLLKHLESMFPELFQNCTTQDRFEFFSQHWSSIIDLLASDIHYSAVMIRQEKQNRYL